MSFPTFRVFLVLVLLTTLVTAMSNIWSNSNLREKKIPPFFKKDNELNPKTSTVKETDKNMTPQTSEQELPKEEYSFDSKNNLYENVEEQLDGLTRNTLNEHGRFLGRKKDELMRQTPGRFSGRKRDELMKPSGRCSGRKKDELIIQGTNRFSGRKRDELMRPTPGRFSGRKKDELIIQGTNRFSGRKRDKFLGEESVW